MKFNGWKKMGDAPVYEHHNGTRVHASGMVRKSCGKYLSLTDIKFTKAMLKMYRLTGWNRRRAYIAYADKMFCS